MATILTGSITIVFSISVEQNTSLILYQNEDYFRLKGLSMYWTYFFLSRDLFKFFRKSSHFLIAQNHVFDENGIRYYYI